MSIIDQIEYSVCQDCLLLIANDEEGEDYDGDQARKAMKRELGDRKGHWVTGVQPTEDDPDGDGYDEFSHSQCELCNGLAGSRHGITLLIEDGS